MLHKILYLQIVIMLTVFSCEKNETPVSRPPRNPEQQRSSFNIYTTDPALIGTKFTAAGQPVVILTKPDGLPPQGCATPGYAVIKLDVNSKTTFYVYRPVTITQDELVGTYDLVLGSQSQCSSIDIQSSMIK